MRLLWIALLSLLPALLPAQPVFNMSNASVNACKGTILGSNRGQTPGHYDHNENYTFTICVPGARYVELNFSAFCTEPQYDYLRIFDGPDTLSPQMGPRYSGTAIPPAVRSSGPCLTLHFRSDANVTCTGWTARWRTSIAAPLLPQMSIPAPAPPCSSQTVTVNFSRRLPCDSVRAAAFQVAGAAGVQVLSAAPLNCINDSTNAATLQLAAPGLSRSGYYTVTYNSFYRDPCDSLWTLTTSDVLAITTCPLEVELEANPFSVCQGSCSDLRARPSGGNFLNYRYAWSPVLPPTAGPHRVCPAGTTLYSVTLTDGSGAQAVDTLSIIVRPLPQMPAPFAVCQSDPPFFLPAALPAGGSWSGPGVLDPATGWFHPDSARGGTHTLRYRAPNGCEASFSVTVRSIEAGPPRAACPGTAPFPLGAATPSGGIWSGPQVSAGGMFTPTPVPGIFRIAYTFAGCTDSATVYIDTIRLAPIDTICESAGDTRLQFWPPGGYWTGNGLVGNPANGVFNPRTAGLGSHRLTYRIWGCDKSFDTYVKAVRVSGNLFACPQQAPFQLPAATPAGGLWSGRGIIDPLSGIYSPQSPRNRNDTLTYTVDGCPASLIVFVVQTRIQRDTLKFCLGSPSIDLNFANTGRWPSNGSWTGPGITAPANPGRFNPAAAGPGIHTLTYTANTCAAEMRMQVHPYSLQGDTSVCEGSPPFALRSIGPRGLMGGPGITDTLRGIFSAAAAGLGQHKIYHLAATGCLDSMLVTVYRPVTPSIDNVAPAYCYKDTSITLLAFPAGGSFSGPGVLNGVFNPSWAGPGQHIISYRVGRGPCERITDAVTTVGPPLRLQLAFAQDTICPGEFTTLSAQGSGGSTGNYRYRWNPGSREGATFPVNPAVTTTYTVALTDGCTQPLSDSATVVVSPPFSLQISSSPRACFGSQGFAAVRVSGPGRYQSVWLTNPPVYGDTLRRETGFNYRVRVTDLNTGCSREAPAEIPFYPFVRAFFSPNPNGECATIFEPVFEFLDQSAGGNTGYWDFGDGSTAPYAPGQPPAHRYSAVGRYTVKLVIFNEGNCADSFSAEVCVKPEKSGFYAPNAFSPNGDGQNDLFMLFGSNLTEYQLWIYDRWGRLLFNTQDPAQGWDGRFRGQNVPEGVYVWRVKGLIRANNPLNNYAPVVLEEQGTVTLIR